MLKSVCFKFSKRSLACSSRITRAFCPGGLSNKTFDDNVSKFIFPPLVDHDTPKRVRIELSPSFACAPTVLEINSSVTPPLNSVCLISTKRQRSKKMNKHKLKKRRRIEKALKKRMGKLRTTQPNKKLIKSPDSDLETKPEKR